MSKTIILENRRARRKRVDDKMWNEYEQRQWISHHWKARPKNEGQWRYVLLEAIEEGMTAEDFQKILEQVEIKRKQQALKKAEAEKMRAIEEAERRRFPNEFLRLAPYIGLEQYEDILKEKLKETTHKEVLETYRLLEAEGRKKLSRDNWIKAITWLNTQIQIAEENPNTKNESIGEKIERYLHLKK